MGRGSNPEGKGTAAQRALALFIRLYAEGVSKGIKHFQPTLEDKLFQKVQSLILTTFLIISIIIKDYYDHWLQKNFLF